MTFDRLTLPGKVFIIGEYAVLDGCSAWIAAVPPRFRYEFSHIEAASKNGLAPQSGTASGEKGFPFHQESPAGQFFAALDSTMKDRVASELARGRWVDAWEGRGGFGGSTAEFAVVAYLAGIRDPLRAHSRYLELFTSDSKPSGADLVAQWVGGVIEWTPSEGKFRNLDREFQELPLLIFSATHLPNRKTKTHSHLETLSHGRDRFASLAPILDLARSGLERQDLSTLGSAFSRYAEALSDLGLEAESAHGDRLALSERPGVLGVKGCGALQTDALIVMLDSLKAADEVISFAESALDLRLLAKGSAGEPGIREEILA